MPVYGAECPEEDLFELVMQTLTALADARTVGKQEFYLNAFT